MAKENDAQEQLTSRQRLNERYRSRNPELNVDDDEALGGAILSDLDAYDQDRERMERFNKTVQDSEIAPGLMAGVLSGKNPDGSDFSLEDYILNEHIDYILDYIDDKDTAKEKLAKRREERRAAEDEAVASEKLSEAAAAALQAEDAELDAALQESGYKAEQVKDLIDWLYNPETGLAKRIADYQLKKEDFLRLLQIKDFDLRMKDAEEKGYKRGRNEKIDMFARQQKKRDGMPSDIGGSGRQDIKAVEENPTVSALKKMSKY